MNVSTIYIFGLAKKIQAWKKKFCNKDELGGPEN